MRNKKWKKYLGKKGVPTHTHTHTHTLTHSIYSWLISRTMRFLWSRHKKRGAGKNNKKEVKEREREREDKRKRQSGKSNLEMSLEMSLGHGHKRHNTWRDFHWATGVSRKLLRAVQTL